MSLSDLCQIGEKLLRIRKRLGFTQSEAAEKAGLSDRTYADIERGTASMRIDTLMKICNAFHITPNEVLLCRADPPWESDDDILQRLNRCSPHAYETAIRLLSVYLQSLPAED